MKKKVISLLLIIITTIVCQIVWIGTANAAQRYMSDDEAIYFLSFVYNCNYKYEDIKNDSFFKMLTGQIDDEQSNNNIKITFLTTLQTQLNQHIDKASYNCDILRSDLQQYLEEQAKGMKNLPEQEYDAFYNKELGYLKDALIDWGAGIIAQKAGIYITEDIIENINLATSVYSDIIGAPEKAKKYADYVINAVKAGFLPINEELTGRYTYFSCYLSNRKAYGYDPNFDLIYDYNKLAIMQNYPLGTIDWYPGSKDSWTEHVDDIERWGDIVIQIENSLTSSGSSSGETGDQYCTITFNSNCDEIPNETRTYDLTAESYDFPTMERAGYVFGGWYADKECTQDPNITGNTATVYAKWIKTQFTITFNSNCNETESYSYIYDSTKNNWLDPYSYNMERPGYAFMGWYTDAACTKKLTGTITIDRDLTFYAKWKQQFSYTLSDGKATITKLLFTVTTNGIEQTDLIIPSTIDGYTVIKIGDSAIKRFDSLENIELPNSITMIGNNAFEYCTNLVSIEFPQSLVSIGDNAFHNCNNMSEVVFSDNITNIGNYAFNFCPKLQNVELPKNLKTISDGVFSDCRSLESIILPDGLTNIKNAAFDGCKRLKSIFIPRNVNNIDVNAFNYCGNLDITVDNNNSYYCDINGVLFNKEKSEIIKYAKDSIQNIYQIPSFVKTIGCRAFHGCDNITDIIIPNGLINISDEAFWQCRGLENINLPNSIEYIGSLAFADCENINKIVIPNKITKISSGLFMDCALLENVELPENITHIEGQAFERCENLKDIVLPNSLTEIGYTAFMDCYSLEEIIIPDKVVNIDGDAFNHCTGLKNVVIGKNVKYIGFCAFEGCGNIKNLKIYSDKVRFEGYAFANCHYLKTAGPIGGGYDYEFIWENTIPESAFSGCFSLVSLHIPDGVISIDRLGLYDCHNLSEIHIPANITTIEENIFSECNNLSDVYYSGAKKEWNNISINENGNDNLKMAKVHTVENIDDIYVDEIEKYLYTGQVIKPNIILKDGEVTLTNGVDYIAEYSNNINAGVAQITIRGTGKENSATNSKYTGSKTVTFNIDKAIPKISKPTGITAIVGQKLADVVLPNNWDWSDSAQICSKVGICEFEAIYTPDDTDNYEKTTCNIKVEVLLPNKHVIKFLNYDNQELQSTEIQEGEIPIYTGATPERKSDEKYTYCFNGWSPGITKASTSMSYTAQFNAVPREYNVAFDTDGGIISDDNNYNKYIYGKALTLPVPIKKNYVFMGWYNNKECSGEPIGEITNCDTGDKTYYAKWEKALDFENVDYSDENRQLTVSVIMPDILKQENGQLIIALYDDERFKSVILLDVLTDMQAVFNNIDISGTYMVKAFYWSGLNNMMPLCDSINTYIN